jgi:preprotein translocase subunit YajC
MIVSTAYAQAAGGSPAGGFELMSFLPLILIFVVFYFLLIRPQQKKLKEHKTMLDALRRGDRVVTGGGLIGTVTKVADEEVSVEIAEGVRVRVVRGTIANVLAKTEPAKGGRDDKDTTEVVAAKPDQAPQAPGSRVGKLFGRK